MYLFIFELILSLFLFIIHIEIIAYIFHDKYVTSKNAFLLRTYIELACRKHKNV